ncbi:MAG: Gfo/Idh/MocA family oxidoreductase, partial [Candidatus Poribacteria bacterium]|nr:Gfo/Idh/MocA family oxidoreductase [Candidatus Poribacteria bacterium]
MSKLRIAVIGSGGMGQRHAQLIAGRDDAELVAVASRNEASGRTVAQARGVPYLNDWRDANTRDDIDGVIVATHNDSHGEIILDALEHGKHVLTEYPLARTIEEGERAVAIAKSTGKTLRITHGETISGTHAALKRIAAESGGLLLASFS